MALNWCFTNLSCIDCKWHEWYYVDWFDNILKVEGWCVEIKDWKISREFRSPQELCEVFWPRITSLLCCKDESCGLDK